MENYLKSRKAVQDYTELVLQHGGQSEAFKEAWEDQLLSEDVNEKDVVPMPILDAINVAVKEDKVFKHFKPVFNVQGGKLVIDTTHNAQGALGHTRNAQKKIQQHTLQTREILPDAIYKLQRLDHMTFLKGGALVDWVLRELPAYVLERLSQAILVGGVVNEDGSQFTAVKPIVGDAFTQTSQLQAGADAVAMFNQLITDSALVSGNVTIFIANSFWAKIATSGTQVALAFLMGQIDLGGVMEKVDDNVLGGANYIIVDTNSYLVGFAGSGIETLSAFEITSNSQYVESRAYVAGTLTKPNSALVNTSAKAPKA